MSQECVVFIDACTNVYEMGLSHQMRLSHHNE